MNIDLSKYQHIADAIASSDSPVGIDAKKTHVMILAKLEAIEQRLDLLERSRGMAAPVALDALQPLADLAGGLPAAVAAFTDTMDDEFAAAAARGQDIDRALRNGLSAALYLSERISPEQLEALGSLLKSDVLHPQAVELIARLARALVAAAQQPPASVGPIGAVSALQSADAKRAIGFLVEVARCFGAAVQGGGHAGGPAARGQSR